MKMYFEEADKLARKTLGAGPVGEERVCDCITFVGSPVTVDGLRQRGAWLVDHCDCQNYDDAQRAQDWCTTENAVVRVRNLIMELTS